ncbi:MAG TPA: hypothetical protein VMT38_12490 [Terracidiphilus sp.]|nr:hypothetical protein [Terracidiphilus sp.]
MPENDGGVPQKPIKISWWKLAVGLILVLVEIKNWLTPDREIPEALRASNETQQFAIYGVSVAIFLVGIGFIAAGIRAIWLRQK